MKCEWLARVFRRDADLRSENDALRESVQSLNGQVLLLQDRLDAALDDRHRMWDLMSRSIDDMKIAYQMHINASWQKQGHGVPYPEAPKIPTHAVPQEQDTSPIARRALPSEAMARQTNRFVDSLVTKPPHGSRGR